MGNHLAQKDANSPWGPYFLSLHAEQGKHFERAEWMIELALKKAPGLGILYYQKGRLLWLQGKYNQAVDAFEYAVKRKVHLVESHLFLGKIFLRDFELKLAKDHLEVVLKSAPRNKEALLSLSQVYSLKRD